MREVEIKIQVPDIGGIIRKLESHGCVFGEPVVQRDVVYIPNDVFEMPTPAGTNVLRIRKQGGKNILTLKQSDKGNHLSKLEHELEISDDAQMDAIIKLLGFKIITDTTKIRRKCKAGEYEICVDAVEDLGDYLEMEKITDQDPKTVQQEMLKYLSDIGIDASRQIDVGYDVLYFRKYGRA
jgi:adenylate cyclase, class 2